VLPLPEIALAALRSVIAFATLLFFMIFMHNKQLSQFTLFDYAVGITIGSIAASMSVELENRTLTAMAGIIVWGTLPIILSWVYLKNQTVRRALDSGPTIVIKEGKILEDNLKRELMNLEDLQMQLRIQGIFDLNDVEYAVVEKNGQVSALKKREKQPLTLADLGVKTLRQGAPLVLISDGKILKKTLAASPYSQEWLEGELEKRGITDVTQVVMAQVDTLGNIYLDLRDDTVAVPDLPSVQEQILVNLEKAAALLVTFALETENLAAKERYQKHYQTIEGLLKKLGPYLQG
jgi:uncharacterized membrane protein YcaP (DUF421 family)